MKKRSTAEARGTRRGFRFSESQRTRFLNLEAFTEDSFIITEGEYAGKHLELRNSRWLVRPMQALQDYLVESLTVWKATQTGGSTLAEAFVAWLMAFSPGNMLYNTPDNKKTRKQANRTIQKLREVGLVCDQVERGGFLKESVAGGRGITPWFLLFQTATEETMQSDTVGRMINDELWLWNKGIKGFAENRAGSFTFPKELNVTSAGDRGSDAELAYFEGTQEEYFLRCQRPACQELFWPLYGKPCEKRYNGQQIFQWDGERYESVFAVCPHCDFVHAGDDLSTRWRMAYEGEYERQNEEASENRVSCRWNGFVSHMRDWWKIIRRWELGLADMREGRGSHNLRMMVLTDLVEPYDDVAPDRAEAHHTNDYSFTYETAGAFKELHTPAGDLPSQRDVGIWHGPERGSAAYWVPEWKRFMTVDVGEDHFWVIVRLYATDGSSRLHLAMKVTGPWEDLDVLQAYFGIPNSCVFVDVQTFRKEIQFTLANVAKRGWRGLEGGDERGFEWSFKVRLRQPGPEDAYADELRRLREEFPPDRQGYSHVKETRPYSDVLLRAVSHDWKDGKGMQHYQCRVHRWSNWEIKTHLYGMRNGKYQYFGVPDNHHVSGGRPERAKYRSEYEYQMNSEHIIQKPKGDGTFKELWERMHANHYWDGEGMGWVAYLAASDERKWVALTDAPRRDMRESVQREARRRRR